MSEAAGSFASRTIVVTGASRGLGRAIAVAFGTQGAYVLVGYRRNAAEAEQTLAAVLAAGGQGAPLEITTGCWQSVETATATALGLRGRIDVLVNNAAILDHALFALTDPGSFEEVLDVNLAGVMRCCRAVVRPMKAAKGGAIVNVSSAAALRASPGASSYAASKGGVIAFSRTLAAELAPKNIRVNTVVPGFLSTGMGARLDRNLTKEKQRAIALGRFGTGAEVAAAVLFLASADAGYVVGETLVVDGGLTLATD